MAGENHMHPRGLRSHWVAASAILAAAAVPLCLLGFLQTLNFDHLARDIRARNEDGAKKLAAMSAYALRQKGIADISQMLADKATSVDAFFRNMQRLVLMERGFAERAWREPTADVPRNLIKAGDMRDAAKRPADAKFDPVCKCIVSRAAPMVHRPIGVPSEVERTVTPRFGRMAFELKSILRRDDKLLFTYLGTPEGMFLTFPADASLEPDYDPRKRDWYKKAAGSDGPIWTPPYEDAGTHVMVMTCAAPVKIDGKLVAVVALDVRLDAFIQQVLVVSGFPQCCAALVDGDGSFVTLPHLGAGPSPVPERAVDLFGAEQTARVLGGREEMFEFSFGGIKRLAGARRIPSVGWTMIVAVPSHVVLALSREISEVVERNADSVEQNIRDSTSDALRQLGSAALLLVALATVIALVVGYLLARRLRALAEMTEHVAEGKFDARAEVRGTRELRTLAGSFNYMASALAEHTERVAREAAERERIATELETAHRIQASLIPETFPKLENAEVHAVWQPARETAGDFYDIFELPDNQIGLVLADVSGKGVGAAVFMTMARALLRTYARFESSPATVLKRTNDALAKEERTGMFVTAVYAVFQPSTGRLTICDAGHNPPLLAKSGTCEWLKLQGGPPLAVMVNDMYETRELTLAPDDTLLVYTDGVTEAFDPQGRQFGSDAFMDVFKRSHARHAVDLCDEILAEVAKWAAGSPQSDDICLLVLRRTPDAGQPPRPA